jgi:hypothetical protein
MLHGLRDLARAKMVAAHATLYQWRLLKRGEASPHRSLRVEHAPREGRGHRADGMRIRAATRPLIGLRAGRSELEWVSLMAMAWAAPMLSSEACPSD